MDDFRTLCAELAEDVRYLAECLRDPENGIDPVALSECEDDLYRARAALAAKPQGEVVELVAWLRIAAGDPGSYSYVRLNRAADLLERQQPVPVPVSERLPVPEDCDSEGRCWWYGEGGDMVGWTYQDTESLSYSLYRATHWLPAHALPLPTTTTSENSEEARQFLANLWPGEAERILRENMISPGEYHQFQKRQAQFLYERLYPVTPSSESD